MKKSNLPINKNFSSESVGVGHPDKICDQIADYILFKILSQDPRARVAVEIMMSSKLLVIGGEITTSAYVDFVNAAWEFLLKLGYSENDFVIMSNITTQSLELKKIIEKKKNKICSGDQGIVYGYAVRETEELMPLAHVLAHRLIQRAEDLRNKNKFKWAKPDMKSLVNISFTNEVPKVNMVLMSIQHHKDANMKVFKNFVENQIIKPALRELKLNDNCKILVNPGGTFIKGGVESDTGLTGRKNEVDSYGTRARHGGGSFSGKDITKIDRVGAYYARWIAKNIVAAKLADEIEVQVTFAISEEKPFEISFNTFGTEKISTAKLERIIEKHFMFSLKEIIEKFSLKNNKYHKLAVFGHFGRKELNLPWEKLDYVKKIKSE